MRSAAGTALLLAQACLDQAGGHVVVHLADEVRVNLSLVLGARTGHVAGILVAFLVGRRRNQLKLLIADVRAEYGRAELAIAG